MKKELAIEIIVFLFVVLFLYAAGSKLTEYNKFVGQMGMSPLLTDFASTLAWLVPAVEIIAALMLVSIRLRMIGMYFAFGLMLVFTLYIITILSFSTELPCSCGGVLSTLGWREHLIFNAFYVLLGLAGIRLLSKSEVKTKLSTASKKMLI